jgi:hypothetical protein
VLGVGGTATVLLAHDTRIGVYRAIKLLLPQYARSKAARARSRSDAAPAPSRASIASRSAFSA